MNQTTARLELQRSLNIIKNIVSEPLHTLFSIWGNKGYWHQPALGLWGVKALDSCADLLSEVESGLNILAAYCNYNSVSTLKPLQEFRDLTQDLIIYSKKVLNQVPESDTMHFYEQQFNQWKDLAISLDFNAIDQMLSQQEDKHIFLTKREISRFATPLFHGVNLEHLPGILNRSTLEARTVHRYWRDGLRRFDHREENYEDCEWIKGISMTRDFSYAAKWGECVVVLNWDELRKRFKFLPVSWFRSHPKREREEFLYFKNEGTIYKTDEESGRMSRDQLETMTSVIGEVFLSAAIFHGFYLRTTNYKFNKEYEELTSHPKFLGMYKA